MQISIGHGKRKTCCYYLTNEHLITQELVTKYQDKDTRAKRTL